MKPNLIVLSIFLHGLFHCLFSDIIKGKITDLNLGSPVEKAKVSLKNDPKVATFSNSQGEYTLDTEGSAITVTPRNTIHAENLFVTLKDLAPNMEVQIRNAKGMLLAKNFAEEGKRNQSLSFQKYPQGMYALSLISPKGTTHFWVVKMESSLFISSHRNVSASVKQNTAFAASFADHLLLYSKPGFKDTTIIVSGSQNDVNMNLEQVDSCGNSIVDPDEVCDKNTKKCNLIAPMKYATGDGECNNQCSGFKEDNCKKHPVTDVSSNNNGKDHRTAAEITGKAHLTILLRIKPGMLEGDFHKLIDSVYRANNYSGKAFGHITGSGPNSIDLHYMGKNRRLRDGEVLLVDIGAKYNGYCGDITRTYPANGKFSPRQREIYQLVLEAKKHAEEVMKANQQSLNQMTSVVKSFFKKSPLRAKDKNGVERTMDNFFIHGLSHYIGKHVHGQGLGYSNSEPVKVGRIFSIEPGLYIESEGFGIRLEDDYIMTSDGPKNLFPNTPIELDHIEALMAQRDPFELFDERESQKNPDVGEEQRSNHMDF